MNFMFSTFKKLESFTILFLKSLIIFVLFIFLFNILFIQFSYSATISSCGATLVSNTPYSLTGSISVSSGTYCLTISGSNITLDCGSNTISGSSSKVAIRNTGPTYNVSINNCRTTTGNSMTLTSTSDNYSVNTFTVGSSANNGVYIQNADNMVFRDFSSSNSGNSASEHAVSITNSENISFYDVTMSNGGGGRQFSISDSSNILVNNSDISDTVQTRTHGIYITSSDNILFNKVDLIGTADANSEHSVYILGGSDNITFKDMRIEGISSSTRIEDHAILLSSVSNITFNDLFVQYVGDGSGEHGIELSNVNGLKFINTTVRNIYRGRAITGSSISNAIFDLTINGATIGDDSNDYPLYLSTIDNVTVRDSYIYNVDDEDAIYVSSGDNFSLFNSTIDNVGDGSGDYGLYVSNVDGVNITNSTFSNIVDDPIYLSSTPNIYIENLNADNAIQYAFFVTGTSPDITVKNSVFNNIPEAIRLVTSTFSPILIQNVTIDTCSTQCFEIQNIADLDIDGLNVYDSSGLQSVYVRSSNGAYLKGIHVNNSLNKGIEVENSNDIYLEDIFVNNSPNSVGIEIDGFGYSNGTFVNISSHYADTVNAGFYSIGMDNSIYTNFDTRNSGIGFYLNGGDNVTISDVQSRFNSENLRLGFVNNVTVELSNFLNYTGANGINILTSDNVTFIGNYIGDIPNNNDWTRDTYWNGTNPADSRGLGNYWDTFSCTGDTIYTVYGGQIFGVCDLEDFTVNGANSRIDYAPIVDLGDFFLNISFEDPTPSDGSSLCVSNFTVNVSHVGSTVIERSTHVDLNYSLLVWLNSEFSNATHVYDNSSYLNDAEMINSPTIETAFFKRGNNLDYSGANQYLSISSLNGTINGNGTTLEAFIYPDTFSCSGGATDCTIISGGTDFYLGIEDNLRLEFCVDSGDCSSISTGSLSVSTWQHVAGTWNSTHCKLYVDGDLVNTTDCNSVSSPSSILVGQSTLGSRAFDGHIDEVKIWKRDLSSIEINASVDSSVYPLWNNYENLVDGSYEISACGINLFGNLSCIPTFRTVNITSPTAIVTQIAPTPGFLYYGYLGDVYAALSITENLSQVQYYLNGNTSDVRNISYQNFSTQYLFDEIINPLEYGYNNITFRYDRGCGFEDSYGGNFSYYLSPRKSVRKNLIYNSPGSYVVNITINSSPLGVAQSYVIYDFADSNYTTAAYNPSFNNSNLISGLFNGELFDWDNSTNILTEISYLIVRAGNNTLIRNFIIGIS